ncbi:MAG: tRNA (adenine(22)-N(1))-methyltransferase TrmK [Polyangiaceae bacterium]
MTPSARPSLKVSVLGVGERVRLIQGDGLLSLVGLNVDVVVLAGLSGATFLHWCAAAPDVVHGLDRLVVQPNGHLSTFRRYAYEQGLHLLDESARVEGGRHFITCAFGAGRAGRDPAYERAALPLEQAFELGPVLFARRDPLALEYYELQARRISALVASGRREHSVLLATFERGLARA